MQPPRRFPCSKLGPTRIGFPRLAARVGPGHLDDGRWFRFPGSLTIVVAITLLWMTGKVRPRILLRLETPSHADPIREPRGGEWHVVEDPSIAAQEAPPTAAGHARVDDLPCGRRHGSCHLVADEPERTAGHRRPLRCRGVPHFQPSRRSERLHIFPAGVESSRAHSTAVAGWSETNPEFRAFVEANRPAVELFIKGAEQVDGISGPVGEPLPGENNSDLDALIPFRPRAGG